MILSWLICQNRHAFFVKNDYTYMKRLLLVRKVSGGHKVIPNESKYTFYAEGLR